MTDHGRYEERRCIQSVMLDMEMLDTAAIDNVDAEDNARRLAAAALMLHAGNLLSAVSDLSGVGADLDIMEAMERHAAHTIAQIVGPGRFPEPINTSRIRAATVRIQEEASNAVAW